MSAPAEKLEFTIEKSRLLQQAIINKAPIEVIQNLIKEGADVNYSEYHPKITYEMTEWNTSYYWCPGVTSLMLAARHDLPDIVAELLKNKADVNAQDKLGMTALMLAARWKSIESAELLIKACANVNNKTNPPPDFHEIHFNFNIPDCEQTALHFALHCPGSGKIPSVPLVQMLLDAGADVKKSDDCRENLLNTVLRILSALTKLSVLKAETESYKLFDHNNGIQALKNIIPLIWQRGSKLGKSSFFLDSCSSDDRNKLISNLDIFPEACLVAQAEYCFARDNFEISDLSDYKKFIMANMGAFAEPIVQYIRNSDRKMRAALDSKKKMETEQEQKQVLDKKSGKEQYEASFVEAASNLIPPNSLQIYSLVRECLQPCSFGVTRIVIDYHHPSDYFPKGFHPMISRLTEKRLEYLNPTQGEKDDTTQPKPKS